jgi:hypothetical protein
LPLEIFGERGSARVGNFVKVVEQNAKCLCEGVQGFVVEFFLALVYEEAFCACRERWAVALVTAEALFFSPYVAGKTECGNRVSKVLGF